MENNKIINQCDYGCENNCDENNEYTVELNQVDGEVMLPPILLETDYLQGDIFYDEEEFQNGVNEYSKYAGMITALKNTGMNFTNILEFILNVETMKMNIELTKLNNEASVEVSKNQQINIEKNQL